MERQCKWLPSGTILAITRLVPAGPEPYDPAMAGESMLFMDIPSVYRVSRYAQSVSDTIKAKGLELEREGKWEGGWQGRFGHTLQDGIEQDGRLYRPGTAQLAELCRQLEVFDREGEVNNTVQRLVETEAEYVNVADVLNADQLRKVA